MQSFETLYMIRLRLQSAARVCTPKRAPKKQPQKRKDADAVEHSPQEAHLPQAPLLERIHEAQKRNEALASVLKAQLAQVSFIMFFCCVSEYLSRSHGTLVATTTRFCFRAPPNALLHCKYVGMLLSSAKQ